MRFAVLTWWWVLCAAACAGSRLNPYTPVPTARVPLPVTQPAIRPTVTPPATGAPELHLALPPTPEALLAATMPWAETPNASPGEAAHLLLEALDLDLPVQYIPVRDGEWDLTDLDRGAGRLATTGKYPGDVLAMVLTAHVSMGAGQRGPFAELQYVPLDAEVVYRLSGIDSVYHVTDKHRIKDTDTRQLYVRDGRVLLLLTCTDWDFVALRYADRLVVRADWVEDRPTP